MKRSLLNFVLILAGSFLYTNLFWREQLGLNTLLFTLFALAAARWRWPEALQRREVQILMGGTLLSALLTVWHNSLLANTRGEVDARFLVEEVSDKNLFLLYRRRGELLESSCYDEKGLENALHKKLRGLEHRLQAHSWRSWNYSDVRNEHFLTKIKPVSK